MPDLDQKAVLITGASSGIGAALARAFSTAGARLVLCARRREPLERVAASLPGPVRVVVADVTRQVDREVLANEAQAHLGGLDILVNNAGLGSYGPFLATELDVWQNLLDINLLAPVALTRLILPAMLTRGSGLILNIASIAGLVAHTTQVAPYVASKHALVGFSRALSRDLAGSGVRVQAACPHLTDTDFFAASEGAERLAEVAQNARGYMDSAEAVAAGIVAGLDREDLIIFPTTKPAKAFAQLRDV